MRQRKLGLVLVKTVSSITNYVVLAVLLLCLVFGFYALLDSSMVYEKTSTRNMKRIVRMLTMPSPLRI